MSTRPSSTARGYGIVHQRLRARWAPVVATGGVECPRCGRYIPPWEPWDLGHPDDDKNAIPTPWHQRCNRQFAASVTRKRRNAERKSNRASQTPKSYVNPAWTSGNGRPT
jgi:hypothetical protein